MNIGTFAVNEEAEIKGIWKNIGDGAKLLVARENNNDYNNKFRELMRPYRSATGITGLTDEEATAVFIEVEASTILLDWEGLTDVAGETVDYSVEKAIEWLTEYKEFRNLVSGIAANINNFRETTIAEVKDNLKK